MEPLKVLHNNEDPLWHRLDTLVDAFSKIPSEEYPYWSDLLYSKAVELQGLYEFVLLNNIIPPFGEIPKDLMEQMELPGDKK